MKSLKNQIRDASFICFGIGVVCITLSLFLSSCGKVGPAGTNGQSVTGPQGEVGPSGTPGSPGSNGLSVVSSSTAATSTQCSNGGTVIAMAQAQAGTPYSTSEPDQTVVVVCNGQNGQTPLSVMYPIAPCTNASSPYKEQLLCLNDGGLLGDFSDSASGLNTRFAFIPTGSYVDTDDSGCNFSVSVDSNGNSTLSYGAGSNQYATWVAGSVTCTNNE